MPAAAEKVARAVLKAREQLPGELRDALSPELAWTLAVALISWRPEGLGGELDLRAHREVLRAFDGLADSLLRFRRTAVTANTALDIAGASGVFLSVVKQIGAPVLRYVLSSEPFGALRRYVLLMRPLPAEFKTVPSAEAEPERRRSRAERYRDFDMRPRIAPGEPDPNSPDPPQLRHWREQLARDDLSPEMRWFYEQKLDALGAPLYPESGEAQKKWAAVLGRNQLNPELRSYFAANLENLRKLGTNA